MRRIMIFAIMAATLAGLTGCDWEWLGCKPKPDPSPSPIPSPSPSPAPFGAIVKTLPASVAGTYGSIDFRDGRIVEYCRGQAKLYFRNPKTGAQEDTLSLDSRMYNLWAVCYDPLRDCWWGTNPELTGLNYNIVKIGLTGEFLEGNLMVGGQPGNPLKIYSTDPNLDHSFYDPGGSIEPGLINVADRHDFTGSSLIKINFINTTSYWEQFWWALDVSFKATVRTGDTYWVACDEGTMIKGQHPILEYRQAKYRKERCDASARTGRVIVIPGFIASSLKYHDDLLWARGKAGSSANIYAISLGE